MLSNPNAYVILLLGGIFALTGAILYFFPPKKINGSYGYRTFASMRSQAAWDFAQGYSSRCLGLLGLSLVFFGSLIEWGAFLRKPSLVISLGIPIGALLGTVVHIERKLVRYFPKKPKS